jgi:cation:H+ antiporter
VTSLIAAVRGHSDIAVGNVVGSNIFNVLLCLGTAALVGSVGANLHEVRVDLALLIGMTVLLAVFIRTERVIRRVEAAIVLALYGGFTAWIVAFA